MNVGGWRALAGVVVYLGPTPRALLFILEPHFQCQPGDPTVEGTVAVSGLGQCFDGLGLECYTAAGWHAGEYTGAAMPVPAARSALTGPP